MNKLSRRELIAATGCCTTGVVTGAFRGAQGATAASSSLTLACANYVRFMPLAAGDVRPRDLALTWLRGDRADMLRRVTDDPAVDGGEASMAQHVMRLDRGDRSFVAIPVFLLRNFTARDLYAVKGARVTPETLGSRRIGIYNWGASGAIWYRHLVRYFGHDPTKISWFVGGVDGPAAVTVPEPRPSHVALAPSGIPVSELLIAGQIDALFAPLPPKKFHPTDGPIVRVLPDFRPREQKYFADTRCYPPQHVLVVRRAVWERDASTGKRLVDTFNECESAFEAGQRQFPYNSPWLIEDVEDAARLMGADYHAHGLEQNHHVIDVFCRSAFEDGLTKQRVSVEQFFKEFLEIR
jgi:4,5-dihydroxyphthalate decarboxylase